MKLMMDYTTTGLKSKEHHQILEDLLEEVGGEIQIYSFQKIIQSLWD